MSVLILFGTIGNVNSKTENDDSLDHIALYRNATDNQIISALEAVFTKPSSEEGIPDEAGIAAEDYFYNGDKPVPIYSSPEVKERIEEKIKRAGL